MALPNIKPKADSIALSDGSSLSVRGLTRGEALAIRELGQEGDIKAMECAILSYGTDTPEAEVGPWYEGAPSDDVQNIIKAITDLSGITGDMGKGSSED